MTALRMLLPFSIVFMAGCAASGHTASPAILLFNGSGTSLNDVAALEDILRDRGWSHSTADSAQLEALSEWELSAYRLIVVPGGNFEDIGNALTSSTVAKLRRVVGNGVGYLGVCAGAFIAGAAPINGLNLTEGVRFSFHTLSGQGTRKAAVTINTVAGATLEMYWEDGPQLGGWGQVVARYADGTPAVVQGRFGAGWIVLTGVHPEAPQSWRRGLAFTDTAGPSRAFAATLIEAALTRTSLPHE